MTIAFLINITIVNTSIFVDVINNTIAIWTNTLVMMRFFDFD